jgi:glyoxylase-like metal-dependent hydrolase (beta-lactamase superfamily II)
MPNRIELRSGGACRQFAHFVTGEWSFRQIEFPALVALIDNPRMGKLLVDTGYGEPLVAARSLSARMYRLLLPFTLPSADPLGQPDHVFLTHYHPDHIGALRLLPRIPILASRDGLAALRRLAGWPLHRAAFFEELLPDDFAARWRPIEDFPLVSWDAEWHGHDIAGDQSLLAVPLPGHALGQYGLLCRLADQREVFLIADAAWLQTNYRDLAMPSRLGRIPIADYPAYVQTLARLHQLSQRRPDLLLLPSHCLETIRAFRSR